MHGAVDTIREALLAGSRRALARAITLSESTRPDHRAEAAALVASLPNAGDTLRIGLTGTPGVGKSSFIEAFGLMLTGQGERVAVLAVDPSSAVSGGSILGDKTRMERLARDPGAFIRPSPAGGEPGGVARRTREAIRLCEAAGFGTVIVETVGVGQSETLVAGMTDLFVLLIAPGGGDELQGVKRGIMELADLILVNKADGELRAAAERTRADYAGALKLMRARGDMPEGVPSVLPVSALEGSGLAAAWEAMRQLADWRRKSGAFAVQRAGQAQAAFAVALRRALTEAVTAEPRVAEALARAEAAVADGSTDPEDAARRIVAMLLGTD